MERLFVRKRATWRWSGLGTAREGFWTAFDCLDLTGNGHLNIKVAGGFNLICFEFSIPLVSLVPFTFLRVIFNFDNFFRKSLFLFFWSQFFFKPQAFQTTVFSFYKLKRFFDFHYFSAIRKQQKTLLLQGQSIFSKSIQIQTGQ